MWPVAAILFGVYIPLVHAVVPPSSSSTDLAPLFASPLPPPRCPSVRPSVAFLLRFSPPIPKPFIFTAPGASSGACFLRAPLLLLAPVKGAPNP
ncbi:hypothetical protein PVAP13_4NG015334 [Panicum virgatum]|uniref:Secreted protein n=1 Tax=Panicum virgatum TaxID=38727 RepID=A0A8T0SYM6_PANVG|nr:hypothetical protein PVAP13_4NG015334 [Panicum virgatum]